MITADEVAQTAFATTQVTRGYDEQEVDDFRGRVVAALRAHEERRPVEAGLTSAEVAERLFTVTQFQAGYDEQEVDAVLDQVVATLRAYESGAHTDPATAAGADAATRGGSVGPLDDASAVGSDIDSGTDIGTDSAEAPMLEPFEPENESLGGLIVRGLRGDPPPA